MSMQIKRGSTEGWNLGPELIDFGDLKVNGVDSTIHCEGNVVEMYVGTVSAERFPEDAESKSPGLWLIGPGEFETTAPGREVKLTMSVESEAEELDGCELAVWVNGAKYPGIPLPPFGRGGFRLDGVAGRKINIKLAVLWTKNTPKEKIKVTFSVRHSGEGGYLLPGQLGAEYLENGATLLKIGPDGDGQTSWKDISYVGQVIPQEMYGDTLPEMGVQGQIFYKKVT